MADTTNEPTAAAPRRLSPVRYFAFALVIVLAMGAGMFVTTCVQLFSPVPEDASRTIVRPTPDVVVAVRDLARLEAVSFHMERVIDVRDRQSRLFGLLETEDAILLVAVGDVSAGVDLTEIRAGDVLVDREAMTAEITLPPPRVLHARLDTERTYVHTRDTEALARRSETLETRARQEAEGSIRQSAIEAGILDRARDNAATTVRTLVESLGYHQVEIRFQDQER